MVDNEEVEKEVAITAKLTQNQRDFLDEYAAEHHGNNRSRALREIINFFKRKHRLNGEIDIGKEVDEPATSRAIEEISDYFDTIITKLEEHEDEILRLRSEMSDDETETEEEAVEEEPSLKTEENHYKKDVPEKISALLEDIKKEDLMKGKEVANIGKLKSLTLKALVCLMRKEKGTMYDVMERADLEENEWKNYAYPGLAYLAEKTAGDEKHVIINPGNHGHWWWFIEDINEIEYPYTDYEKLPDDILNHSRFPDDMREHVKGNYSENCFLGRNPEHVLSEEVLRVLRHIQTEEQTKKSTIIEEVYVPYINKKEDTWWKTIRSLLDKIVADEIGYIDMGKTIKWTGEPI